MADDFNTKLNEITNTADNTGNFDKNDIEQNKVMALLSYIWILVLVPIFAAPSSKYARFHANQGLVLLIAEVIFGVVGGVLGAIFAFIPFIGWIIAAVIGVIFGLFELGFLALAIIGIINAVQGKAKDLPVLGKIRILK